MFFLDILVLPFENVHLFVIPVVAFAAVVLILALVFAREKKK